MQQHYAPEASPWPDQDELISIWDLVNGSAITIGPKRWVIIPTEDSDGLDIPQEWVDIPAWTADYYLAVQMDLEGHWLRVWGYTTHQHLKAKATYDAVDRTYCVPAQMLNTDLNAFWTIVQTCPDADTQATIAALPALSAVQATALIDQIGQTVFPRLSLPFDHWGALLQSDDWRQALYQKRLTDNSDARLISSTVTVLRDWFQAIFTDGWQSLELFIDDGPRFAFRNRGALGNENDYGLQRVKFITLNTESEPQTLALIMALKAEADGRTGVQVQVYPNHETSYVPPHLTLALYSAEDEVLQSIQARDQEDSIRLPSFKCLSGTQFRLQLSCSNDVFNEAFSV